ETQMASTWSKSIPLRVKKPAMRSASSSPVAPERVWKRQCSARRSPSKAPRWVWVLPTSTARSMPGIYPENALPPAYRDEMRSHGVVWPEMSDYTKLNLGEVEDFAPEHGFGERQEARFAGEALDCEQVGVSLQRVKPGQRQGFGHRHGEDEEVYVVLSG